MKVSVEKVSVENLSVEKKTLVVYSYLTLCNFKAHFKPCKHNGFFISILGNVDLQ